MFGQIAAGIGLVVAGGAIGIRAAHRKPVPADVAAQLRAGLATQGTALLDQLVTAYTTPRNKWLPQVQIVCKAAKAGDPVHDGADTVALYRATLATGDVAQMQAMAKTLSAKHHVLAANLTDVAKILGG